GGTRGIKVSVKGDGDTDWVVIHDKEIGTKSGEDLELDVNRTNCQIKFENYSNGLDNNAYVTDLAIYGNVTFTGPLLDTFTINGTTYDADDVFEEDSEGNMVGTVNISKTISVDDITVTAEATNGSIAEDGGITISTTDGVTTATIVVTDNGESLTYILTIGEKPDYTLTYYDQSGNTLGTQTVEEDATIGSFAKTSDDITVEDGYAFRGWFESADGGRKFTTDDVITQDTCLYAVVTEIETKSTTARYAYDLTDEYFYPEDHEAFVPSGWSYNGSQHGGTFSSNSTIELLVGGEAYILLDLCSYSSDVDISISNSDGTYTTTQKAKGTDGQTVAIHYKVDNGETPSGTLTLTIGSGTVYLHSVTIDNVAASPIAVNEAGWYILSVCEDSITNGDNLLKTLDIANANASASSRTYIFLPNGTYDLGNTTLTQIYADSMSIIGQSMDSTIVVNTPETESINATATFLVTGINCYFQDLTLKNAYPYYTAGGSSGRAVCLHDKGNHTICKNVKMLSYQDTYYSNNNDAELYFETSEIHGTVDFICGGGAVYFQNCDIVVESRSATEDRNGSCVITAPQTKADQYGYVFNGCSISNNAKEYTFGRGWQNYPECVFMNTTLKNTGLTKERWTLTGMNTMPNRFYEYNTLDSLGIVDTPESNELTFTYNGKDSTYNTVISENAAKAYELESVFTDWKPATYTQQLTMGAVTSQDETIDETTKETTSAASISWDTVDNALAYAIFKDGEFVAITDGSSTSYVIGVSGNYTIRAANQYGGFGKSSKAKEITTIIKDAAANNGSIVKTVYYNLSGARVSGATKGVVIKVDTMENGKQVATKIVK
ncbi:MAG: pectinesterase family protein, partial [Prevotella sp.]|nr:pectinesterase family protein [Prevotella sp.]